MVPEEHLQFEGQTKDKLGSPLARPIVDSIVSEHLTYFLMENGDLASNLVRKAIKARDAREAARKARDASRNGKKNKKDKGLLSGKLTPAQSKNAKAHIALFSHITLPLVSNRQYGTLSSYKSCRCTCVKKKKLCFQTGCVPEKLMFHLKIKKHF